MYTHIYIYCVYANTDIYIYIYMHTYMHIYIYVYIHEYIHIHIQILKCIHIYIYMHTYIHIYVYVYIHTYICKQIHILKCQNTPRCPLRQRANPAPSPPLGPSTSCSKRKWGLWATHRQRLTCALRRRRAFSSTSKMCSRRRGLKYPSALHKSERWNFAKMSCIVTLYHTFRRELTYEDFAVGLPQWDHAPQFYLPFARVRADGDWILHRAWRWCVAGICMCI